MTKRPLTIPDCSRITDDTPLRLAAAAELGFPGGGVTANSLRRERDAGRQDRSLLTFVDEVTVSTTPRRQ